VIKAVLLLITTIIISQNMDLNIINTFLFHPRKSYQDMDEKDIQINVGDSVQVGIRLHLINKSFPTILFFHGNGEIGPEYDDIARVYNQKNKFLSFDKEYEGTFGQVLKFFQESLFPFLGLL